MLYLIIISLAFFVSIVGLIIVAGECLAMDYPKTKFSRWWRRNLIDKQKENYDTKNIDSNKMHSN